MATLAAAAARPLGTRSRLWWAAPSAALRWWCLRPPRCCCGGGSRGAPRPGAARNAAPPLLLPSSLAARPSAHTALCPTRRDAPLFCSVYTAPKQSDPERGSSSEEGDAATPDASAARVAGATPPSALAALLWSQERQLLGGTLAQPPGTLHAPQSGGKDVGVGAAVGGLEQAHSQLMMSVVAGRRSAAALPPRTGSTDLNRPTSGSSSTSTHQQAVQDMAARLQSFGADAVSGAAEGEASDPRGRVCVAPSNLDTVWRSPCRKAFEPFGSVRWPEGRCAGCAARAALAAAQALHAGLPRRRPLAREGCV